MNWLYLHKISEYSAISTSILLNIVLTYLSLTEKNAIIKSYRKLILLNTVSELGFTAIIICSQPVFQYLNGVYMAISTGPLRHWPIEYHYILIFGYLVGLGMSFLTLPIDYFYRYFAVCKKVTINLSHMLLMTVVAYAWGAWDSAWVTAGFMTTVNATEEYGHLLSDPMWYEDGEQMKFVPVPFKSFYCQGFIVSGTIAITLVYASVFFLSEKIYKALDEQKHIMSAKTMKQQKNMNYILMAQAIIPLFTGLFPIITMFLSTAMSWNYIETGFISSVMMSWMPSVSPLCYLIFVNSFRRRILKAFTMRVVVTVVPHHSTTEQKSVHQSENH